MRGAYREERESLVVVEQEACGSVKKDYWKSAKCANGNGAVHGLNNRAVAAA